MPTPITQTPFLFAGTIPLPPAAMVEEAYLWTTFVETHVGQTFGYITTSDYYEIPQSVAFVFEASADVGNRQVQVAGKDDRARNQWVSPASTVTGPGAGVIVSVTLDAPSVATADGSTASLFMPQWVMLSGYRIILSSGGFASPTDTWFNVSITTIRVPSGPPAGSDAVASSALSQPVLVPTPLLV